MLSAEDNKLLRQIGPGTLMGTLMRRYWLPVLLDWELPDPDCAPVRVKLLGENLVAFRDSEGRPGVLAENCPHRGASLFFGRNEECGLRCVYHGWKFDVTGQCIDMPNEPPESNFQGKIVHTAYPCLDIGGVIWAYLGPAEHKPALPKFGSNAVPASHRFVSKRLVECNYSQTIEGCLDSSHASFLHRSLEEGVTLSIASNEARRLIRSDTRPRIGVIDTDYGILSAAKRHASDDRDYVRTNVFLMPCYTMAAVSGEMSMWNAWVPRDDVSTMRFMMEWHPGRPLNDGELARLHDPNGAHLTADGYEPGANVPGGSFRAAANRTNDYLVDRATQRQTTWSGIPGIGTQDQAAVESMGPIYDRTREHLATADLAIIAARRRLLNAAQALANTGEPPPGVLSPDAYSVRAVAIFMSKDDDWVDSLRVPMAGQPDIARASV